MLALILAAALEQPVLRYTPKHEELKYTFGGVAPSHRIKPARDYAISSFFPDLPEKVWFYEVDRARGVARTKSLDGTKSWEVPLAPFLGCLGVSPGQEVRSTIVPDFFGGKMSIALDIFAAGGLL